MVHNEGPGERYKRRHYGDGEDGDLDDVDALALVAVVELGGLTVPMKREF